MAKFVGTWWNDSHIELWEIDGEVYALDGWNGEEYLHCWKCAGERYMTASDEEYTIAPVYHEEDESIEDYEVKYMN